MRSLSSSFAYLASFSTGIMDECCVLMEDERVGFTFSYGLLGEWKQLWTGNGEVWFAAKEKKKPVKNSSVGSFMLQKHAFGFWFILMGFRNPEGKRSHSFIWTEIEKVIMLWTPEAYWFLMCCGDFLPELLQHAAFKKMALNRGTKWDSSVWANSALQYNKHNIQGWTGYYTTGKTPGELMTWESTPPAGQSQASRVARLASGGRSPLPPGPAFQPLICWPAG